MTGGTEDVDKGYAYVILTGSIIIYMLVVGGTKTYGLLYTEMLNYFQASSGRTGWIGGLLMFLSLGLGSVSNLLSRKYSFRKVTFIGGLVAGLGHIITAFVPSLNYVIFTYGFIVGTGYGLLITPSLTIVSYFFDKHRYFATAVIVAWSGVWSVLLSFFYEYLFETYGLRGTLLIAGGITLNACAGACVFVQPEELKPEGEMKTEKNGNKEQMIEKPDITLAKTELCKVISDQINQLKRPTFIYLIIAFTAIVFAYMSSLNIIPASVRHLGYGKTDEAINIAIMGSCDVMARLAFGRFTDKKLIRTRFILAFNLTISGVYAFFYPTLKSLIYIRIYSSIAGVFITSYISLVPPLLIETFGMKDYPAKIGLLFTVGSVLNIFTQPLIGWTEDTTGDWNLAFILTGADLALGSLALLIEPLLSRIDKCRQPLNKKRKLTAMG